MKKKNLLLTAVATLGLTAATMAQNVPSYVPTNGLVGWWPFNGNANDESLNGNNGTVNGATLTADRNGNANSAYDFNGLSSFIEVLNSNIIEFSDGITFSAWISPHSYKLGGVVDKSGGNIGGFRICVRSIDSNNNWNDRKIWIESTQYASGYGAAVSATEYLLDNWQFVVGTYNGSTSTCSIYLNGALQNTAINLPGNINNLTNNIRFGLSATVNPEYFNGLIDDIAIYNRALTQSEITALYNSINCYANTSITPQVNSLVIGSTVTFSSTTSDSNPSYVWQSNLGQGFQTLNDIENYSGTNTSTLNITNIQLSEHNQPIRVITTSGECVDTSDISYVSITDTCINFINDTSFVTVTDTLIINTLTTDINALNNTNTIKVFPNPANDHITIDYGNFVVMNGFQLKIENSIGQMVFQTNITQQNDYLSLNNWGGNGLYFVHIIDAQGNTIDIRKIVLQ